MTWNFYTPIKSYIVNFIYYILLLIYLLLIIFFYNLLAFEIIMYIDLPNFQKKLREIKKQVCILETTTTELYFLTAGV